MCLLPVRQLPPFGPVSRTDRSTRGSPLPTLYAFSIFTTITSRDLISRKQSKSSGPLSFMNPLPQYGSGLHSGVRVEREVEVELSERPEVNPWKEQDQEKVSPEVSQV